MQKRFALGETVRKHKGGDSVVRAIFVTREGQLNYAVQNEASMDFVEESRLSPLVTNTRIPLRQVIVANAGGPAGPAFG